MKILILKILGPLFGLILICWLLSRTGTSSIFLAMKQIQIESAICALLLIVCGAYLRALRWKSLFIDVNRINIYPFFSAIMIGCLANTLLPIRGGELVRVYMLNKHVSLSKSSILATVLIERLSEFFIVCVVMLLLLYNFSLPSWVQTSALVVGLISFFGLLFLIFLSKKYHKFTGLFFKLLSFLPERLVYFLKINIREFIFGIRGVISRTSFFYFISLTLLIWSCEIAILWFFAASFGFILSFMESWVVLLSALLSIFIPIFPAQIGVWEFSVQSSMAFLGYEGPAILAFALSWHLTLLFVGSVGGLICLFLNGNNLFETYKKAQQEVKA